MQPENLTLQIFHHQQWHDAAELSFDASFVCTHLDYLNDYAFCQDENGDFLCWEKDDSYALGLNYPVNIMGYQNQPFTLLDDIQENIFNKALTYRDQHIYECNNYDEFKQRIKDGGFFLCHWDGTEETEAQIKEETQATIRCVPFGVEQTEGIDMVSGKPAKYRVIIARSY